MSLRTVVLEGVEWTVWDVVRTLQAQTSVPLPEGASPSWLCFSRVGEKRRLVPAPLGWETWTEDALILALRSAPVVATVDQVSAPGRITDRTEVDRLREERVADTLQRARDLDARVRRAMADGGAKPLADPKVLEEDIPLPRP